jgi:hypothetical protein
MILKIIISGSSTSASFCVEAPLSCVSGVAGSEPKQRIARILSGEGVRKLDLRRKALLALALDTASGG